MAKVIQNFLVGVGLDTREFDKGAKNVDIGLSKMRTTATLAGAALVGAFGSAASSAVAAGKRVDGLMLAAEKFNTSPQFIYNYGNAIKSLGGEANEAMASIAAAADALDDFKLKGSFSAFEDAVFAGVDTNVLAHAADPEDFLRKLSGMMPDLNKEQQRLLQKSFGLSDAAMRSLRDGQENFDKLISRAGELGGNIEAAAEASRSFNRELAELDTRFQAIGNTLAIKMLPPMENMLKGIGEFLDSNQQKLNTATDVVANNPEAALAIGGGAFLAGSGAATGALGMKSAGSLMSRIGIAGMAFGSGYLLGDYLTSPDETTGRNLPIGRPARTHREAVLSGEIPSAYTDPSAGVVDYSNPVAPNRNLVFGDPSSGFVDYNSIVDTPNNAMGMVDLSPVVQASEGQFISNQQPIGDVSVNNNLDVTLRLNGRQFQAEVESVITQREEVEFQKYQSTTGY